MSLDKTDLAARFHERFGQPPRWVVRAPGRVNLIGEHTDYNDGFVMPMAIDRAVWIALRPRADRRVSVFSVDYSEQREFSLDELKANDQGGWIEYLRGTAWSLQDAGMKLVGWEGVLQGDVPLGAGLSSSAALEMAAARALAVAGSIPWDAAQMAKLGQRAENHWVGGNCGIMDQLISAAGRAGHALLIDCRSLETQPVPLPPGTAVVVLDTATRRGLVDSAYNERRAQCEAAARFFGVKALRDVTIEQFEQKAGGLDGVVAVAEASGRVRACSNQGDFAAISGAGKHAPYTLTEQRELMFRRARHVIGENDRTFRAAEAMRRGDAVELGRLMAESHRSLRDDYEVSSDALNAMVECAAAHPACFGARMTGAGFGGCAMALIQAEAADDFTAKTAAAYQEKTGRKPAVYVCQATNGAEVV